MRHPRERGRPHWWPEGEPWPPAHAHRWRRRRSRFLVRVGLFFAVLLAFSAIGVATLVSALVRGFSGGPWSLSLVDLATAALFALVLLSFPLAMRRFGFPLGDLVTAADRVAHGDYSVRVAEHGPPSLRSVARAFNTMTATLQSQDKQRRNLMADVAHELRTPLSVIQGRLEGLLDGVYPREDAVLGQVVEETRILARLIEDLRTLANAEAGSLTLRKEPTDLAVLLQDVVNSFASQASDRGVGLQLTTAHDLPLVDVDPVRMGEVLSNLIANAVGHTGKGGGVSVSAERETGRVLVKVADTGEGIAEQELPKIFDRFYKGSASRGSGLGLTIARNLIVAHGGDIRAASRVGEGTVMTVTLPGSAEV